MTPKKNNNSQSQSTVSESWCLAKYVCNNSEQSQSTLEEAQSHGINNDEITQGLMNSDNETADEKYPDETVQENRENTNNERENKNKGQIQKSNRRNYITRKTTRENLLKTKPDSKQKACKNKTCNKNKRKTADSSSCSDWEKNFNAKKTKRKKPLNAIPNLSPPGLTLKPRRVKTLKKKNCYVDSLSDDDSAEKPVIIDKNDSWFCNVCKREEVSDMRRCRICSEYVHEKCVGITEEDDDFVCENCCIKDYKSDSSTS